MLLNNVLFIYWRIKPFSPSAITLHSHRHIHSSKNRLLEINRHSGAWGIQEAALPWCQSPLLPSNREWLFYGQQDKCDPQSCCRLFHQDSLLLVHYIKISLILLIYWEFDSSWSWYYLVSTKLRTSVVSHIESKLRRDMWKHFKEEK